MAVLLETSKGDMVIDLHCDECPRTTKNFLKLCKIKYYNNCLFHSVTRDFAVQTGDPTARPGRRYLRQALRRPGAFFRG